MSVLYISIVFTLSERATATSIATSMTEGKPLSLTTGAASRIMWVRSSSVKKSVQRGASG